MWILDGWNIAYPNVWRAFIRTTSKHIQDIFRIVHPTALELVIHPEENKITGGRIWGVPGVI